MRSVVVFPIGVGSMLAAYGAFALAMTDERPISAPPWLVPAAVVVAGALAAIVDRRPRALGTVLAALGLAAPAGPRPSDTARTITLTAS